MSKWVAVGATAVVVLALASVTAIHVATRAPLGRDSTPLLAAPAPEPGPTALRDPPQPTRPPSAAPAAAAAAPQRSPAAQTPPPAGASATDAVAAQDDTPEEAPRRRVSPVPSANPPPSPGGSPARARFPREDTSDDVREEADRPPDDLPDARAPRRARLRGAPATP